MARCLKRLYPFDSDQNAREVLPIALQSSSILALLLCCLSGSLLGSLRFEIKKYQTMSKSNVDILLESLVLRF